MYITFILHNCLFEAKRRKLLCRESDFPLKGLETCCVILAVQVGPEMKPELGRWVLGRRKNSQFFQSLDFGVFG